MVPRRLKASKSVSVHLNHLWGVTYGAAEHNVASSICPDRRKFIGAGGDGP